MMARSACSTVKVLAAAADDRGDLQFEVLPSTSGRRRGVVVGSQNGRRTGEVERGDAVPGVGEHPAGTQRGLAVAHVVQEAQGIADRRRARDRRHQRHLVEPHRRRRTQRVLARLGAARRHRDRSARAASRPAASRGSRHRRALRCVRRRRLGRSTHFTRAPPHLVSCPAVAHANSIGATGHPGSIRCSAPRRPEPARRT